MEKKWYQKTWFMWVMLIFFLPIGLFLMWKYSAYSKKAKIIITAIFALLFIVSMSGNKSTNNTAQTNQQSSSSSSSSSSSKQKKEPPVYKCDVEGVGKVIGGISSDVGIAIYKIEEAQTLGTNQFAQAQAQGKFVVVSVVCTNKQKDAVTIDANSFKLVDKDGNEYSYSPEGQTAIQVGNGNAKGFLTKVNPGITIDLKVPFDIPKDAKDLQLKARGGMTGKSITLPLTVQLEK